MFRITGKITLICLLSLTALIMLSGLSLTACATTPTLPPTETVPVTLTPDNPRAPLTATPTPNQPGVVYAPDTLGKLQFLQNSYLLIREDEMDRCDLESGICPTYLALLADVYTWLYVQPGETYSLQFALDSRYQIQPIEPNQACQIQQDAQDANLIAVGCANTGEYVLLLEVKDTQQNVQYPLRLNVFSIPDPGDTLLSIPQTLWFEEYELTQHPETEPRSFTPVTGTAAGIEERHAADRGQPSQNTMIAYLANGQELRAIVTPELTQEMSQSGELPDDFQGFLISIQQDREEIFATKTPVLANNSFIGLWTYENHWFIEVIRLADSFRSLTRGEIYEDGQSLDERYGYTESFGFQLMHGKPFYFFERDGQLGIVYEGREFPLGYYRILHNGCCSSGVLNPVQYENMVGFFAVRGDKWVYTEIGAYENPVPTAIPAQNGWTEAYTATIPVASVGQATQEEIAGLLFTQWLDHFKTPDADSRSQLDEYILSQVEIPNNLAYLAQEQGVDFVAYVTYSVKPTVFMYSNWIAGNGILENQTWIRDKGFFIGVVKEDDVYRLKIIGTGP